MKLRGSLPYAAAIIGGFLLAYLIVAFVIFPSGVVPGDAKVPNVTGLLFDDASKRLAAVGFKASRGDDEYREATPINTVLSQDPPAGTKEAEGTAVTLTVSTATRP
ncbi:MAG TPA: PASTA domain-containing protein [Gemmatimonadaceae bacterium]|jgi:beta-lactam-binding protein with PASTA domain|nr:PASTA domain-containing protein [Gemmatimonadaceae bacterium]